MSSSAPTSTSSSSTSRPSSAIAPRDALASAGKTLVELFGLARELNVEAEGIEIGPSPTDAALAADLALPVEDLQLTIRSYNCLKREGIHTVGELVARSEADLLDIRNFGAKSITEVKEKLAELGLSLKDSPLDFDPTQAAGVLRRRRGRVHRGRAVLTPDGRAAVEAAAHHPSLETEEIDDAYAHQGSPARWRPGARAADPGQPGHQPVRAQAASRPPRPRPSACARWPSASSRSPSAATCTRAVAC